MALSILPRRGVGDALGRDRDADRLSVRDAVLLLLGAHAAGFQARERGPSPQFLYDHSLSPVFMSNDPQPSNLGLPIHQGGRLGVPSNPAPYA